MKTKQKRKDNFKMHRRDFLVDCEDGRRMKLLQDREQRKAVLAVLCFDFCRQTSGSDLSSMRVCTPHIVTITPVVDRQSVNKHFPLYLHANRATPCGICVGKGGDRRSQWLRDLWRGFPAARLLGLRVRILPEA